MVGPKDLNTVKYRRIENHFKKLIQFQFDRQPAPNPSSWPHQCLFPAQQLPSLHAVRLKKLAGDLPTESDK